jgi:P27 family predicted phage terminase small subunit
VPAEIQADAIAVAAWRALAGHLARLGLWRDETAHLVLLAAQLESRRRRAEEAITAQGMTVLDQRGRIAMHPAVRIADACGREIRAIYRDLGLIGGARQGEREDLGGWLDFAD